MQVWAIGTVRNEADILRANVLHHLGEGVDRFLLLDDGSSDDTPDLLRDLGREHPLEWGRVDGRFRQDRLLTDLARTAFIGGADWVIPIDADEFWCAPGRRLRDVLAGTDAGAVWVDVVNFVQRREQVSTAPDALLHMTRRVAQPVGPVERIAGLVESERVAYVEILYPPKWIARASARLEIGWGNHTVAHTNGPAVHAAQIVCLHAPLRSRAVFEQKLDRARPLAEVGEYLDRAWHLARWRRLAAEGRLDAEWRANSYAGDGTLDVHGAPHALVIDTRLRDVVARWLPAPAPAAPRVAPDVRGRLLERMRSIEGWLEDGEAELLMRTTERVIRELPAPQAIVEIGSYCGRSTIVVAGTVHALGAPATVYAIDPHTGEVGASDSPVGVRTDPPTLDRFLANVRDAGLDGVVELRRQRSTDVAWTGPVSLLFVDGLHDYESVRRDVAHFAPWIVPGGYLALHDHCDDFPGVQACVKELLATGGWEVYAQAGPLLVLQRAAVDQPTARAREVVRALSDELDEARRALGERDAAVAALTAKVAALDARVTELLRSASWRVTAPLRALGRLVRRGG